jgi:hypothetical protein
MWYNKNENFQLEGLHQKPPQMEKNSLRSQNFSEVVAPKEEEEEDFVLLWQIWNLNIHGGDYIDLVTLVK